MFDVAKCGLKFCRARPAYSAMMWPIWMTSPARKAHSCDCLHGAVIVEFVKGEDRVPAYGHPRVERPAPRAVNVSRVDHFSTLPLRASLWIRGCRRCPGTRAP